MRGETREADAVQSQRVRVPLHVRKVAPRCSEQLSTSGHLRADIDVALVIFSDRRADHVAAHTCLLWTLRFVVGCCGLRKRRYESSKGATCPQEGDKPPWSPWLPVLGRSNRPTTTQRRREAAAAARRTAAAVVLA